MVLTLPRWESAANGVRLIWHRNARTRVVGERTPEATSEGCRGRVGAKTPEPARGPANSAAGSVAVVPPFAYTVSVNPTRPHGTPAMTTPVAQPGKTRIGWIGTGVM